MRKLAEMKGTNKVKANMDENKAICSVTENEKEGKGGDMECKGIIVKNGGNAKMKENMDVNKENYRMPRVMQFAE